MNSFGFFVMPILAQRLLLNIRAADRLRTRSLVSTFLLDPTPIDGFNDRFEDFGGPESQIPTDGGHESPMQIAHCRA